MLWLVLVAGPPNADEVLFCVEPKAEGAAPKAPVEVEFGANWFCVAVFCCPNAPDVVELLDPNPDWPNPEDPNPLDPNPLEPNPLVLLGFEAPKPELPNAELEVVDPSSLLELLVAVAPLFDPKGLSELLLDCNPKAPEPDPKAEDPDCPKPADPNPEEAF